MRFKLLGKQTPQRFPPSMNLCAARVGLTVLVATSAELRYRSWSCAGSRIAVRLWRCPDDSGLKLDSAEELQARRRQHPGIASADANRSGRARRRVRRTKDGRE